MQKINGRPIDSGLTGTMITATPGGVIYRGPVTEEFRKKIIDRRRRLLQSLDRAQGGSD